MTKTNRHSRLVTVALIEIFLVVGLNEFEISQRSSSVSTAERAIVAEKATDEIRLEMRFSYAADCAEASPGGEVGEKADRLSLSLVDQDSRG